MTGGRPRERVVGTISSAGFAGGHRFVVGSWRVTPIGPFCDVMWADAAGHRTLLASSDEAAGFITSIYGFDEVRTLELTVESDGRTTRVDSDVLRLQLEGGRLRPLPVPRPLWFTRYAEAPFARLLMGVRTCGVAPSGAREWYQTSGWRYVHGGGAVLNGVDLGDPGSPRPALRVGFSEPPPKPSIVSVRVTIERP